MHHILFFSALGRRVEEEKDETDVKSTKYPTDGDTHEECGWSHSPKILKLSVNPPSLHIGARQGNTECHSLNSAKSEECGMERPEAPNPVLKWKERLFEAKIGWGNLWQNVPGVPFHCCNKNRDETHMANM